MEKSTLSIEAGDMRAVVKLGETNLDGNVRKLFEILDGMTITEIHDNGVAGLKDGMKIGIFVAEDEEEFPQHIVITYYEDNDEIDSETLYFPSPLWKSVYRILYGIIDEAAKQTLRALKDVNVEIKEE